MAKQEQSENSAASEAAETLSIDAAFEQLNAIVEKMDASDVSLEESLKLYKEGVGILNQCGTKLSEIEKEIIVLTEEGEMPDGIENACN